METGLVVFKNKEIRRVLQNGEWYFAVVDVVAALTDSDKLESSDGKKYQTEMANTEGISRIIQSIPSPKAEPFNRWLAMETGSCCKKCNNSNPETYRFKMVGRTNMQKKHSALGQHPG